MASIVSHALAGAAVAAVFRPEPKPPARYWIAAIGLAVIPDIDGLLLLAGAVYRGMWGHRGITHSLAFAAVGAAALVACFFRSREWKGRHARLWATFFAAGATHGILDSLMASGLGVAFFAPISATRYRAVFRPIRVTPGNENAFLNTGGIRATNSEILWLWIPSLVVLFLAFHFRPPGRRSARTTA